jgi:hypothetical protein
MAELYPDPPHLTVAIYSERPEVETFARMHDVALQLGCDPLNTIEISPADQEFELLSDLGTSKEILQVAPTRYAQLVAGEDHKVRVLRAGLVHAHTRPRRDRVCAEDRPRGASNGNIHQLGVPRSSRVALDCQSATDRIFNW